MNDQINTGKRLQQIDFFFADYAARFNRALKNETPDAEGTASSFSDCFIESGPSGIQCGKNDDQFLAAIPRGYEFYRNTGITSMEIVSKKTVIIDALHSMTKVHWKSDFKRKDHSSGSIDFDVTYLIRSGVNGNKIFAYITGDEQKALRESNLI